MNGYNKWNKTVTNVRKGKFDNLDVGGGEITVSFVSASTVNTVYLNVSQSTTGINASYVNASFTNMNVSNASITSLSSSLINSSTINTSNLNSSYIICTNIKSTSACFTSASLVNNLFFTTGRYAAPTLPVLSVSNTPIRGWDWFNLLQGCNNAYNVIVSPYNEFTNIDNTLQIIGSKDRYLSTNYNGSFSYFNAVVSRPPFYVFPQSGPGMMYVTDGDMGTSSLKLRSDSDVQRVVYTDCLTFAPNDAGGNDNYQVKISSSGLNVSSNAYLKSASATNASITYLSGLSCSYSNASLYNTTMENTSITSASISNASILMLTGTSCSYTNASLSSVTISNVSITSASISNASIAWISGSTLNYLNVSSGNASSNNITSGTCSFTNASISNASITWISGSTLNYLNVSSGNASSNNITSGTCSFTNASISNASITWISGSTLNYLNVSSGNASSNNITSGTCSFTNASISNASITWISGSTLNFTNVSAGSASHNNITSGTCFFTNATLSNVTLTTLSSPYVIFPTTTTYNMDLINPPGYTYSYTIANITDNFNPDLTTGYYNFSGGNYYFMTQTPISDFRFSGSLTVSNGVYTSLTLLDKGQYVSNLVTNTNTLTITHTGMAPPNGDYYWMVLTLINPMSITGGLSVTNNISSVCASFNNITCSTCSFTNASISNASITRISGSTLNFTNVSSGSASHNNLTSGTCSFTNASISNASITSITGTTANYTNMSTTSISITNCSITNLTITNNNIPFLSTSNVSAVNTTGIINVSGRVVINASNNASQLLITCPSNVSQSCGIMLTNPSSGVNASGSSFMIGSGGNTRIDIYETSKALNVYNGVTQKLSIGSTNIQVINASLLLSSTPSNSVSNDGALCLPGTAAINFGYDQTKDSAAGKISYGAWDANALCIVGAGNYPSISRNIHMWDDITISNNLTISHSMNAPTSTQVGYTTSQMLLSNYQIPSTIAWYYTGLNITLSPGTWMATFNALTYSASVTAAGWLSIALSNSSTSLDTSRFRQTSYWTNLPLWNGTFTLQCTRHEYLATSTTYYAWVNSYWNAGNCYLFTGSTIDATRIA